MIFDSLDPTLAFSIMRSLDVGKWDDTEHADYPAFLLSDVKY